MTDLPDKRAVFYKIPLQRRRQRWAASLRQWRLGLQIFADNRLAMVGVMLIAVFAFMALIHPLLLGTVWPRGVYNPVTGYDETVAPWPSEPTAGHLLGVDVMGRDILSMLMAATRPTFVVAISAALATAILGTIIGAVSAYFRGPLDTVLYQFSNSLYLLPAPVLIAIIGARFLSEIDSVRFGLLYGALVGGGSVAIILRSHALTILTRPYIEASRVAGSGAWHIITRHLIPGMLPLVLVQMMLAVVGAVVADGFIAFFGLRNARLNWGTMIYNSILFLNMNPKVPWAAIVAPTAALSLFAAAFYMVARGLQDVIDPSMRSQRR